ncbi:LysE/ArgO family amino acid transporter [Chitinibacteraceae bacterium HSL-7]
MWSTYWQGMALCASLIMAIGAQNAHVLRVGLMRQHVVPTIAVCIVLDGLLIALGVAGMARLIEGTPWLMTAVRWGGAVFLIGYGLRAWLGAWRGGASLSGVAGATGRREAVMTVLALSLLNPHVYLDTVLLVGGIGGQYAPELRPVFVAGAWSASLVWFLVLGLGARYLAPLFAKPLAWRVLDGIVGAIMLLIAAQLLR